MIVGVLVEITNDNVDKIFDYQVPVSLINKIKIGQRVLVPFASRTLEGFVLEIKENSTCLNLKEIIDVIGEEISLNKELLNLGKEMKKETLSSLMSCYQAMLPKALKAKAGNVINKKYEVYCHLIKHPLKTTTLGAKIIEKLEKGDVSFKTLKEISLSAVNTLLKNGYIEKTNVEIYRYGLEQFEKEVKVLNEEQQLAVNKVLKHQDEASSFLLYGVTGSGKTEVYMELIEDTIKRGKTSIVLVPEISLTPQIIMRFTKRFGDLIAVLHSGLNDGEKYDEWRKIYRGEVKIVIGARSAIFAPLENIGMIIIDEEHSPSYKQDDANPKYETRDIAFLRSKYNKCPVVMGSATPSLTTFAKANKGLYELLTLQKRANQKDLPIVDIIDMAKETKIISKKLDILIKDRLEKHEQIILLLNRRGYASFLSCKNCGEVIKCPNCDITLTYHKTSDTLRCHYCGYGTKVIDVCPKCHEKALTNLGTGTEKVEEILHEMYPTSKVLRMDIDTTSQKGRHQLLIRQFENHEADILLGTQMVAKGLDFPLVTLVGVINADTSLNIPSFSSSEATFQLLTQVSGRSGRSLKTGQVVIQTYNKEHYAITFAKNHDYLGFYESEMALRRQLKYPPYYYLTYVKILSKDYDKCSKEATKVKNNLQQKLTSSIILGPTTCNVFKVNNVYRFGIIIKYKKEPLLYQSLEELKKHYCGNNIIRIDIDFNCNTL